MVRRIELASARDVREIYRLSDGLFVTVESNAATIESSKAGHFKRRHVGHPDRLLLYEPQQSQSPTHAPRTSAQRGATPPAARENLVDRHPRGTAGSRTRFTRGLPARGPLPPHRRYPACGRIWRRLEDEFHSAAESVREGLDDFHGVSA